MGEPLQDRDVVLVKDGPLLEVIEELQCVVGKADLRNVNADTSVGCVADKVLHDSEALVRDVFGNVVEKASERELSLAELGALCKRVAEHLAVDDLGRRRQPLADRGLLLELPASDVLAVLHSLFEEEQRGSLETAVLETVSAECVDGRPAVVLAKNEASHEVLDRRQHSPRLHTGSSESNLVQFSAPAHHQVAGTLRGVLPLQPHLEHVDRHCVMHHLLPAGEVGLDRADQCWRELGLVKLETDAQHPRHEAWCVCILQHETVALLLLLLRGHVEPTRPHDVLLCHEVVVWRGRPPTPLHRGVEAGRLEAQLHARQDLDEQRRILLVTGGPCKKIGHGLGRDPARGLLVLFTQVMSAITPLHEHRQHSRQPRHRLENDERFVVNAFLSLVPPLDDHHLTSVLQHLERHVEVGIAHLAVRRQSSGNPTLGYDGNLRLLVLQQLGEERCGELATGVHHEDTNRGVANSLANRQTLSEELA
mmetsp:Transcript_13709/g.54249  ORF Transcript_13709/g.54249 Transcript_13709/m.54249 type:complete len:479 (+) Transcript_13709:89-1525(+)